MLGRGAYGLAVAVINRLDGRQYAVKKIRLQRQIPSEYSRITREVATLSRLQHTNIVRYFQVGHVWGGRSSTIKSIPAFPCYTFLDIIFLLCYASNMLWNSATKDPGTLLEFRSLSLLSSLTLHLAARAR